MKYLKLALLFTLLLCSVKVSSQSVLLTMPDTLVNNGDNLTIPIHLLYTNTNVAAIQFDVVFDASVLTTTACSLGSGAGACNPAYAPDTIKFAIFSSSGVLPNDMNLCFMDFDVTGSGGSQTQFSIINLFAYTVNLDLIPNNIISVNGGNVKIDCTNTLLILSGEDYFIGDVVKREAHQSILAFNKINSGADIIYDAGSQVSLQSGFEVLLGAEFTARIDGCFGQ